jgi:hypothetical protein
MHTALPLQVQLHNKMYHTHTHTHTGTTFLHYIFTQFSKNYVCQLPITGSKQNKEQKPLQSLAAGLQECPMTVINTFPCTVDCFLAILSNVYKRNT